jgi:ADP-ribose pyrophosphatase YjhB (NUDIX family)
MEIIFMVKLVRGERVGKQGKLAVSATAIVFDAARQKILLTKRKDNGRWCLPGGAMEAGESIMEACVREVYEETGLRVHVKRLVGVYSNPHILLEYADGNKYHMVNLCFEAETVEGEAQLSDETTDFGYFSPSEIEAMDLMEHHRNRIEDALSPRSGITID